MLTAALLVEHHRGMIQVSCPKSVSKPMKCPNGMSQTCNDVFIGELHAMRVSCSKQALCMYVCRQRCAIDECSTNNDPSTVKRCNSKALIRDTAADQNIDLSFEMVEIRRA